MKCFVVRGRTILGVLCIALVMVVTTAVGRSVSVFKVGNREIPIYSVQREDNKIALTFDCAWNADDIRNICDTLDQYNAKATFFVVGDWAEKYPDSVKLLSDKGHEIGNHSYNHAHYNKLSKQQMLDDIEKCDNIVEKITGKKPVMFRSPYGEYNDTVVKLCDETGRYYIQWSVDSIDYGDASGADIIKRSTEKMKNGDILLMHNGTKNTAAVLPQVLETLTKNHTPVTVSDLIYKDNYVIDHTGMQSQK